MKIRTGFVSNSSSSSFIIACNDDYNDIEDVFSKYYEDIMEIKDQQTLGAEYLRNIKEDLLYNAFENVEWRDESGYGCYSSLEEYRDEYYADNPYNERFYFHIGENITEEEHYQRLEKELKDDEAFKKLCDLFNKGFKKVYIFELRNGGSGPNHYEEGLCYSLENKDHENFVIRRVYD